MCLYVKLRQTNKKKSETIALLSIDRTNRKLTNLPDANTIIISHQSQIQTKR